MYRFPDARFPLGTTTHRAQALMLMGKSQASFHNQFVRQLPQLCGFAHIDLESNTN
jgi:hypothetical protein